MPVFDFTPLGDGFYICASPAFPFLGDGMLLAEFSHPKSGDLLCDLGCGSGTLPLLFAKTGSCGPIHAVDLQQEAIDRLAAAAKHSGASQIRPLCADLRALDGLLPAGAFDLVTCNPPYHPAGSGRVPPASERRVARHEAACTFSDICGAAARLLRSGGRFCLCMPPGRLPEVFDRLQAVGLEPKRLQLVQHDAAHPPFLALIEARRGGKPGLAVEPVRFLKEDSSL